MQDVSPRRNDCFRREGAAVASRARSPVRPERAFLRIRHDPCHFIAAEPGAPMRAGNDAERATLRRARVEAQAHGHE
jgi:hypothetical protein